MSMQLTKPEDLSNDNLFAVLDLAIEIQEQAELSTEDELRVPVRKSVMRYESERQSTSLDRRPTAIKYLNDAGCFSSLRQERTKYPTGLYYAFVLNCPVFNDIFRRLLKCEEVRTAPPIEKAVDEKTPVLEGFYFDQGILFRNGSTVVEKFIEDTFEHELLRIAFKLTFGEQIDTMIDDFADREWRTIYDASRRINDKVMARFGISDFFKIDYKNKFIERNTK